MLNRCEADYCGVWEVVSIANEFEPGIGQRQIVASL